MTRMVVLLGAAASMALLVTALWAWGAAPRLTADVYARPEVVAWAVRSGAVAAAAAAQAVLLVVVLKRRPPREDPNDLSLFPSVPQGDPVAKFLGVSAGLVSAVAFVSAIALALAGR
jgi:hypothetical protein